MQSSAALLNNAVGLQSTTTAALIRRKHPNESSKANTEGESVNNVAVNRGKTQAQLRL